MAIIVATAVRESHRRVWPKGARQLADDALAACLEQAQVEPGELELLINAGIYRERNLAEPALASMIQEDVGVNPSRETGPTAHGTFSFDVANGGCGVLTALELLSGFVASQVIETGALVASDSDPGNSDAFPFPHAGGAVLLRPGPLGAGFIAFASRTFPEDAARFGSVVAWHEHERPSPWHAPGRNALELVISPDYAGAALEHAAAFARRFLAEQGLRARDVELLVASAHPPELAADLARKLELAPGCVAPPDERYCGAYTAGVIASLDAARASGRLAASKNTLLVAVGPGITVATALYRHAP